MQRKSYTKYLTMIIASLGLITLSGCSYSNFSCDQFNSLSTSDQQLLDFFYGDISRQCDSGDVTGAGIVIDS